MIGIKNDWYLCPCCLIKKRWCGMLASRNCWAQRVWQSIWRAWLFSPDAGSYNPSRKHSGILGPRICIQRSCLAELQGTLFYKDQELCSSDLPGSWHTKESSVPVWFISHLHYSGITGEKQSWISIMWIFKIFYYYKRMNNTGICPSWCGVRSEMYHESTLSLC